jgi:hypothetical protein
VKVTLLTIGSSHLAINDERVTCNGRAVSSMPMTADGRLRWDVSGTDRRGLVVIRWSSRRGLTPVPHLGKRLRVLLAGDLATSVPGLKVSSGDGPRPYLLRYRVDLSPLAERLPDVSVRRSVSAAQSAPQNGQSAGHLCIRRDRPALGGTHGG